ncbi:MAG TPA: DUF6230 family protein [Bacillales bacterium]|nr:DUF6230 family protein [Bacillales bacterium]
MEAYHHQEEVDEPTSIVSGRTVKKHFFAALIAGFLMLGGLAAAFGISGVAFAMPIGGIGNFHVQFDKLVGTNFLFFPKLGETGKQDKAPMVRNKIDEATVYGLHIYKDITLPGGNKVRLNITSSKPVKIKGLIQDARFVSGDFHFNHLTLAEHNTSDFSKEFTQTADHLTISNSNIVTDYLFQSMVTLNGTKISIEDIPDQ